MIKIVQLFVLIFCICNCKSVVNADYKQMVKTDTLFQDKISIRAISVTKDTVWYAANKGRVGYINLKNNKKYEIVIPSTSNIEFRSIAINNHSILVLSVGNPAVLYKLSKDLTQKELVYEEQHEKVFYDSMQFFDDKNGIAIGDPITNCFSIILTHDGGKTWSKLPCETLPKLYDGEAAFAASNTNIVVKADKVWVVSGGKKARVFYSENKGKTWQVYDTTIIQGEAMTGIFTADFYNEKTGIIAGGNYEKPNDNDQNKAITTNGGKSWKLIANQEAFGYTSCIQFFPDSKGKKLISVGASGIYVSNDKAKSWHKISDDNTLFTIRFIDKHTVIAAGKDKMIRLCFKD